MPVPITEKKFGEFIESLFPGMLERDEHAKNTPKRVATMYQEFFNVKYPEITTFTAESSEMVLLKGIPFYSICAHHWLPFFGDVHIAYIPDEKIIGLSKVPRLVDFFSRSPQVQETLTSALADHLLSLRQLKPQGVAVVVEGRHFCLEMRGAQKPGVITTTSALRGTFLTDTAQRAEFMSLIRT